MRTRIFYLHRDGFAGTATAEVHENYAYDGQTFFRMVKPPREGKPPLFVPLSDHGMRSVPLEVRERLRGV